MALAGERQAGIVGPREVRAGIGLPDVVHGQARDRSGAVGGAIERLVVDDGELTVGGEVDVELDGIGPGLDGEPEGLHRVLRSLCGGAAVGDDDRHRPRPRHDRVDGNVVALRLALRNAAQDGDPDEQQDEERRDRDLVRAAIEAVEQRRHDRAVHDRADDRAELPDQPVEAEHLADSVRRREAQQHEPINDADPAEPGAEQRAGEQERDGRQEEGEDREADGPDREHREERAPGSPSVGDEAPAERRDDRHHGQDQQDLERLPFGEADGVDGERAHDRDRGVDRVRIEEARHDESQQPRRLPRVRDGLRQLAERAGGVGGAEAGARAFALANEEEERAGEDERRGRRRARRSRASSGRPRP